MTTLEKRISINKMLKLANRIEQIIEEMKDREIKIKNSYRKAA